MLGLLYALHDSALLQAYPHFILNSHHIEQALVLSPFIPGRNLELRGHLSKVEETDWSDFTACVISLLTMGSQPLDGLLLEPVCHLFFLQGTCDKPNSKAK